MIRRSVRVGALLLLPAAVALAADCGGAPFAGGGGSDASTGGPDGSGNGGDATGSSSGGAPDAPACTPDLSNQRCNDCVASHCDADWCDCAQDTACETYVGCLYRGGTLAQCTAACACSAASRSTGDKLIGCSTLHCSSECASGSGSSSGGSSSSSGASSSSSGGSSSSSGASSSSSGGSSSSSGGPDSGSGGHADGGFCICPVCTNGDVCCTLPTSAQCGQCFNPACGACCGP